MDLVEATRLQAKIEGETWQMCLKNVGSSQGNACAAFFGFFAGVYRDDKVAKPQPAILVLFVSLIYLRDFTG